MLLIIYLLLALGTLSTGYSNLSLRNTKVSSPRVETSLALYPPMTNTTLYSFPTSTGF